MESAPCFEVEKIMFRMCFFGFAYRFFELAGMNSFYSRVFCSWFFHGFILLESAFNVLSERHYCLCFCCVIVIFIYAIVTNFWFRSVGGVWFE